MKPEYPNGKNPFYPFIRILDGEKVYCKTNDGFVFPPIKPIKSIKSIEEFYYTELFDLKMTSNYKQVIKNSKFIEYLKSLFKQNVNVLDMTGNIGADAVILSEFLPQKKIFTCELDRIKAKCLKKNCSIYPNIYVFCGDSDVLFKAILENDIETICNMCISDNKSFIKSLYGQDWFNKSKWIINIDPPFGKDYDKDNESNSLSFCDQDIINYFKSYENHKNISKVYEYIIKSPPKWNRFDENIMNFRIETKKSYFNYNIYTPDIMKQIEKTDIIIESRDEIVSKNKLKIIEYNNYDKDYKRVLKLASDLEQIFELKTHITSFEKQEDYNNFMVKLETFKGTEKELTEYILSFILGFYYLDIPQHRFYCMPHNEDFNLNCFNLIENYVRIYLKEHKIEPKCKEYIVYFITFSLCEYFNIYINDILYTEVELYEIYLSYKKFSPKLFYKNNINLKYYIECLCNTYKNKFVAPLKCKKLIEYALSKINADEWQLGEVLDLFDLLCKIF